MPALVVENGALVPAVADATTSVPLPVTPNALMAAPFVVWSVSEPAVSVKLTPLQASVPAALWVWQTGKAEETRK